MNKPSLSVVFLTLNEEFHIGSAIENVKDIADEIFVLDSLSVDRTVDVALGKGAKVYQRKFKNFGDQWNAALKSLPIDTDWTMKMDPDERLTPALKTEILSRLENAGDCDAFKIVPALHFMGKNLHLDMMPVTRIWRTGIGEFSSNSVNEHFIVNSRQVVLKNKFLHLGCRDLHQWVDKQNRYTTAEAIRRFRGDASSARANLFGTSLERRMWLKKLFFHLPFRYCLMFIQYYLLKGMWMRGRVGFHYTILRIWSRRMIEEKLLEMRLTGRELVLPPNRFGFYDTRVPQCD